MIKATKAAPARGANERLRRGYRVRPLVAGRRAGLLPDTCFGFDQ